MRVDDEVMGMWVGGMVMYGAMESMVPVVGYCDDGMWR